MTILSLSLALAIAYGIVQAVKAIAKFGFKASVMALLSPIKTVKAMHRHRKARKAERKLIKENRAYWTVGQDLDKHDALARYKKDERVIKHPSVKAFELDRKSKQNKADAKKARKASKSKAKKTFDKVTK